VTPRSTSTIVLHVRLRDELSSAEGRHEFQRASIRDARQHDGVGEEGQKSVGGGAPSRSCLAEILQTSHGEYSLTSPLRHQLGEPGQRSDVGQLVEGQHQANALVVSCVGRIDNFIDQPHHQACSHRLVPTRRDDVQVVAAL